MRIDVVLKYLCLVKSRSIAKALCEKQLVLVDGQPVRSAAQAIGGRRVTIQFPRRPLTVELLEIPRKQLSKTAALDYYRRVETPPADAPAGIDEDGFDGDPLVDPFQPD